MTERSFYVLAYDIACNKRRARIAKAIEALCERVQGSVFEAYLSPAELAALLRKTDKIMQVEEDTLRVYTLCAACKTRIITRGHGHVTPPPAVVVV